jgi:hypothetical protein
MVKDTSHLLNRWALWITYLLAQSDAVMNRGAAGRIF